MHRTPRALAWFVGLGLLLVLGGCTVCTEDPSAIGPDHTEILEQGWVDDQGRFCMDMTLPAIEAISIIARELP